jgi:hypothetical protein
LSKGQAELVEAFVLHDKGFDRLSPNGDNAGLRHLSPNGSLPTMNFAFGPKAEARSPSVAHSAVEQLKRERA